MNRYREQGTGNREQVIFVSRIFSILIAFFLFVGFISCENQWMINILEREKDTDTPLDVTWPPLSGDVTIEVENGGIYKIGATLFVNTDDVTAGGDAFSYQWKADGENVSTDETYTIQGSDAGKLITCIVSRAKRIGELTATGEFVPYTVKLAVDNVGETVTEDYVSFEEDNDIVEIYCHDESEINIYYSLADSHNSNSLELSIGTETKETIVTGKDEGTIEDSYEYTVNAEDAENGVITITAEFTHTNLLPDPIEFEKDIVTKTCGDAPFINAILDEYSGSGNITYSSENPEIASVDEATGEVTIHKAGTTVIKAEKAADSVYDSAEASYTLIVKGQVPQIIINPPDPITDELSSWSPGAEYDPDTKTIEINRDDSLILTINTYDEGSIQWMLDGTEVNSSSNYTFTPPEDGYDETEPFEIYTLTLNVKIDGKPYNHSIYVKVLNGGN